MKVLKDIRGIDIEVGDTIAFTQDSVRVPVKKMGIGVVRNIDLISERVSLNTGDNLNIVLNEVLVLPCHYKEW